MKIFFSFIRIRLRRASRGRFSERLLRPDPPAGLPGGVLESAGGVCRGLLFQTPARTPHSSTARGYVSEQLLGLPTSPGVIARATRTTASHPLLAFGTCQSSQTPTDLLGPARARKPGWFQNDPKTKICFLCRTFPSLWIVPEQPDPHSCSDSPNLSRPLHSP